MQNYNYKFFLFFFIAKIYLYIKKICIFFKKIEQINIANFTNLRLKYPHQKNQRTTENYQGNIREFHL